MKDMQYQSKRPFSLPAFNPGTTDEDYEAIFGTEEERKEKLRKAIEEQKDKKKAAREASEPIGLPGDIEERIESGAADLGIPSELLGEVKRQTAEQLKNMLPSKE
jgi:LDH2 family malate/lactate/ureidoglycolate dehydrogenase